MAVTADDLRVEVNAGSSEEELLTRCVNLAVTLVGKYISDNQAEDDDTVPTAVQDQAVLVTAAELFNQHNAPNGYLNQVYDGVDGTPAPIRISADPMRPAYPLLSMWIMPVIA